MHGPLSSNYNLSSLRLIRMKNKTLTTWLTFLGGPLGLHRFYLHGLSDTLGWAMPIPTALGIYGIQRMQQFGMDDALSWVLIPLLGFTMAGCALSARTSPGSTRSCASASWASPRQTTRQVSHELE